MKFSSQEWVASGDPPHPGIKPASFMSPALAYLLSSQLETLITSCFVLSPLIDASLSICSIFYIDSCSYYPSPQINDTSGAKDDKNHDGAGRAKVWKTLCLYVPGTCLVHDKTLIMLLLLSVIFHMLLKGQIILLGSEKRSLTGNKS